MAKVIAVCTSQERGTQKENIHRAELIEDWGIEGDAHAGKWHRQVSLLSYETIEAFRKRGADVADGAVGETLVVSGYYQIPSWKQIFLWRSDPGVDADRERVS